MGADQIGFLLIGPADIPERRIAVARRHAARLKAAAETQRNQRTKTQQAIYRELRQALKDYEGYPDGEDLDARTQEVAAEGESVVDEMLDAWGGDQPRDVASRTVGRQQIWYAGDMSWGDTPDGEGYRIARLALVSGVAARLGIH
jgi:hypothetical protein